MKPFWKPTRPAPTTNKTIKMSMITGQAVYPLVEDQNGHPSVRLGPPRGSHDRDRQPEGRRGEDDHRRQPRRRALRKGPEGPSRGPGSAGPPDHQHGRQRRVGKECRARWRTDETNRKEQKKHGH